MGAAPAYSYYPERAPQRAPRERISVVPGRGARTQTPTLPSGVVVLAKAVAVVLFALALVGFARVALASATVATSMENKQISSKIDAARADGVSLEVSQSTLSNPGRLKQAASSLKMSAPESVGTIELPRDVVVTDEDGSLSLAKSVAAAAQAGE